MTQCEFNEVVIATKDLSAAYLAAEVLLLLFAAGTLIEVMRVTTGTGL